jgi:hypothetical protein
VRAAARSGSLLRMHEPQNVRLILDIDPDGETIRGSVSKADQGGRPFFGWLELAAALEAARQEVTEPSARVTFPGVPPRPLRSA